ncbi:unnamed protein product [Euphydryas editha]|uniref:FP protein C-terminal domain-containing protein n=1 Tax=Euphydryas editha TaxID=104508 RepID=A0AAU9V9Y1_EUPED|nr:unnamed protein product [Euphydryas editha]
MSEVTPWGCCDGNGVDDGGFIRCNSCMKRFHYECLSLTKAPGGPNHWKCPTCKSKLPKTLKDDTTPIRNISTTRGSKRVALNSPPTAATSPSTDFVTAGVVRTIVEDVLKEQLDTMYMKLSDCLIRNLNEQLAPIKKEMEHITDSMAFMNDRFDCIEGQQKVATEAVKELKEDNYKLNSKVVDLTRRINYLEQQSRSNNLEIQCVPEKKNENLMTIISQLGSTIDCKLNEHDILNCTRVAKLSMANTRPRSIVVQLASTRIRDQVIAATYKFNKNNPTNKLNTAHLGFGGEKSPVFIQEHLSPQNKALHAAVRIRAKEKGYKYVWVRSGKIFVRKSEDSGYLFIRDMVDLDKLA